MLDGQKLFLKQLPSLIESAEKGNLNAQHTLGAFYATDDFAGLKMKQKR